MLWLLLGCVGARLDGTWIASELIESGVVLDGPHLMDVTATEGGVFVNVSLSDRQMTGCGPISRDAGDYLFQTCVGAEILRCKPGRWLERLDCFDDTDRDNIKIEWLFLCEDSDPGCGLAEANLVDTGALEDSE